MEGGAVGMSGVDKRVVDMQFNNKQFEDGIQSTLKALDRLRNGLNLDNSTKSLRDLQAASRTFSLVGIAEGIESINRRFSTLGIVGFTVIQNLTNSAIAAGKRMTNALLDPLVEGGKRRALNIEKAKFQFEGLGMDVESTMESALAAVKGTAFGLDEAAVAASQFGATGLRAGEEMTAALRGISGVAAMTSSSYSDISQIFTTVAGNGRLMGTELMRLSTRGVNAAAVLAKQFGVTEQEVRSMVTKGEVSFRMFAKAMDDAFGEHATKANDTYTGSLSNMRSALARIGATVATVRFESMRKVFNALTPVIDELHNSIKPLLGVMGTFMEMSSKIAVIGISGISFSGLDASIPFIIEGITNVVIGLANALIFVSTILEPIEQAFRDIFPPLTAKTIVDITAGFRSLMENLQLGEHTIENIRRTFRGLFAALDIGKMILFAITKLIFSLIQAVLPFGDSLLYLTAILGDFVYGVREALTSSDGLNKGMRKLGDILGPIIRFLADALLDLVRALDAMVRVDTKGVEMFADRLQLRFSPLGGLFKAVGHSLVAMVNVIKKAAPIFATISSIISDALSKLGTVISTAFRTGDFNAAFDILNSGLFAVILISLRDLINRMAAFTTNLGGFGLRVKQVLFDVKLTLMQYQAQLKANVLMKIATAIAILAGALTLLSLLDSTKLTVALGAMTTMFLQLIGALGIIQKLMSGISIISLIGITAAILGISAAMVILSFAVTRLAKIEWEGLLKGLVGVAGLIGILVGASVALQKSSAKMIKGSVGLILFATSLLILTSAVKKLGDLDVASLSKGLVGVGVLAAQIVLFMKFIDMKGFGLFKGLGLIGLATGLLILSSAVKKFAELDSAGLARGLVGMGVILTQVAIFMRVAGGSEKIVSTAIGLTILGAAMLIFASAVSKMGQLSWGEIARGLATMGGALAIIAGALMIMPKGIVLQGAGLILLATSLIVLSNALANMGGMSWGEIGKSLLVLATSLAIIAGAMYLMVGALPGAAALVVVAGALAILTPALMLLGSMSLWEIIKSLLALVGAFAVVAGAATLLAPVIPLMLALAGTLVLLGLGLLGIGVGILAFSAGMTALAVSGTAGTVALVAIITSIISLIPMAAKTLALGLVDFIKVIGESVPIILEAVTNIIVAIIDSLVAITPKLIDALFILLDKLLTVCVEYIPRLIDMGMLLVLGLLEGIANNIGKVVATAIDIVINLIRGIASKIGDVMQAGVDLILAFINGITDTFRNNDDKVLDAVEDMVNAIVETVKKALKRAVTPFKGIGKDMVDGMVAGVRETGQKARKAATDVADGMVSGVKSLLRIQSPSRVLRSIGNFFGDGLIKGVEDKKAKGAEAAKDMADGMVKETSGVVKKSNEASKDAFRAAVEWIDERKYYNQLSLQEELEAWQKLQRQYIAGTDERKRADREVYRVQMALIKMEEDMLRAQYNHSLEWIDERKYYNELSLQEELAAWERVQSRYEKGTSERKKADREVYRLKMALIRMEEEEVTEAYKRQFNNSLNWIDERKYYQELSLNEELAAWERVQARYLIGSEERKKADREVYRVKNEINKTNEDYFNKVLAIEERTNKRRIEMEDEYYQNTKRVNDQLKRDIQSVTDEYKNAVKSRAKSLYDEYKLFDSVQEIEPVSGEELMNNLKDQIVQFDSWRASIQELAAKGVDEGLIAELEAMGPKSIEQIRALNRLNAPMLNEYVHLWKVKHEEVNKQATNELEDLRLASIDKIAELNRNASTELDEYRRIWTEQLGTLTDTASAELEELNSKWKSQLGELSTTTEKEFDLMAGKIKFVMTRPYWSRLGQELVNGITAGVKSSSMKLVAETVATAMSALNATKEALGIQSPSKEFAAVGNDAMSGLILGLTNLLSKVKEAGMNVGITAKEALSRAMSNITELVNGEVDLSPTIRPILDLSDVKDESKNISSLLGKRTIGADGRSIELINSITTNRQDQTGLSGLLPKLMDLLEKKQTPSDITNEFSISSLVVREEADVKRIARELYNLQVSVDRG
jgi:tape measure domain-containing protein